jgi:hypothetical protein
MGTAGSGLRDEGVTTRRVFDFLIRPSILVAALWRPNLPATERIKYQEIGVVSGGTTTQQVNVFYSVFPCISHGLNSFEFTEVSTSIPDSHN